MANRRFTSQFAFSWERQLIKLMGNFTQSGSTGAFATLVSGGITYTAVTMGAAGNSITIALVAGGTAGAEVVTVTGKAISVSIESGVSTRTQVLTALQASAPASALIGVSVTSGGTAATPLAATHLASGVSTSFTQVAGSGMLLSQIGTGLFQIDLSDSYAALIGCGIMIQKASATDIKPQLKSVDVLTTQKIVFRTVAVGTNTNLADGDVLYISLEIRNSQ